MPAPYIEDIDRQNASAREDFLREYNYRGPDIMGRLRNAISEYTWKDLENGTATRNEAQQKINAILYPSASSSSASSSGAAMSGGRLTRMRKRRKRSKRKVKSSK